VGIRRAVTDQALQDEEIARMKEELSAIRGHKFLSTTAKQEKDLITMHVKRRVPLRQSWFNRMIGSDATRYKLFLFRDLLAAQRRRHVFELAQKESKLRVRDVKINYSGLRHFLADPHSNAGIDDIIISEDIMDAQVFKRRQQMEKIFLLLTKGGMDAIQSLPSGL
jgi:hypothetical protein